MRRILCLQSHAPLVSLLANSNRLGSVQWNSSGTSAHDGAFYWFNACNHLHVIVRVHLSTFPVPLVALQGLRRHAALQSAQLYRCSRTCHLNPRPVVFSRPQNGHIGGMLGFRSPDVQSLPGSWEQGRGFPQAQLLPFLVPMATASRFHARH